MFIEEKSDNEMFSASDLYKVFSSFETLDTNYSRE